MSIYTLLFYGLLLGISDLVPGFSAGTMAITLNIYDRIIQIISHFFKDIKNNLLFLVPIIVGMGIGILLFSGLFKYLLTEHRPFTFSLFSGLLLGTIYHLYRSHFYENTKDILNPSSIISTIIGFLIPIGMIFFYYHSNTQTILITDYLHWNFKLYIGLFFAGILGAFAMILPGISGSLLLILLGLYDVVIGMVQIQEISSYGVPLLFFAGGIIVGILLGSLTVSSMLKLYAKQTVSFMFGILLGSLVYITMVEIRPVFQFRAVFLTSLAILLAIGFYLSYRFGKMKRFY